MIGDAANSRHHWLAHRLVWAILIGGELPEHLHHRCKNKACVNPDHLEPITASAHTVVHAAEKTHCKHGHEFTPENTYIRPDHGSRMCRECLRIVSRSRKKRWSSEKQERLKHIHAQRRRERNGWNKYPTSKY